MGKALRKVRPQPPHHIWWEVDGCWFCKKKNACGGCKVMKEYVAVQKEKQKRKDKRAWKGEMNALR